MAFVWVQLQTLVVGADHVFRDPAQVLVDNMDSKEDGMIFQLVLEVSLVVLTYIFLFDCANLLFVTNYLFSMN